MREIKFRVWHTVARKMFQAWSLSFYAQDGALCAVHPLDSPYQITDLDKLELLQFTGLHDANGREIYEGDILKIQDATAKVVFWEKPPEFGLNFYHNEDAWCEDWNLSDDSDRMEIIGNIYENPEILPE